MPVTFWLLEQSAYRPVELKLSQPVPHGTSEAASGGRRTRCTVARDEVNSARSVSSLGGWRLEM